MITLDELTLWELGHRLAGANPYRSKYLPLTSATKDAFRNLATEIYEGHLESSLIYEKKTKEHDMPAEYFIRAHLDSIWDIQSGRWYSRSFLQFVSVERVSYLDWCDLTGYPTPEFWPELDVENLRWYQDDDLTQPIPESESKTQIKRRMRKAVTDLAKQKWSENDQLNLTDISNMEDIQDAARHYSPATLRKWIQPHAPEHIKGKRGRPKKPSTSDT